MSDVPTGSPSGTRNTGPGRTDADSTAPGRTASTQGGGAEDRSGHLVSPGPESPSPDSTNGQEARTGQAGGPAADAVAGTRRALAEHRAPARTLKVAAGVGAAVGGCMAVGSVLSDPTNSWYRSLDLPSWQPPGIAFPIVWTGLYASIAVAGTRVLVRDLDGGRPVRARENATALGANLVLNTAWSGLFFRARRPRLATAWAGVLALSSADLARRAGQVSRADGALLAPYAAWTAFATVLSGAIARRNPRG